MGTVQYVGSIRKVCRGRDMLLKECKHLIKLQDVVVYKYHNGLIFVAPLFPTSPVPG